jgi:uncharacterized membrane-anchored protein
MKIDEAVSILRAHNEWRRSPAHLPEDARGAMGDPRQIGIAIDTVCDALSKSGDWAHALRLADECEESAQVWAHEIDTRKRAAAELRRLHVQYAQDEALLRQALDALAYWLEHGETPGSHDIIQRTHDVLRKRLK